MRFITICGFIIIGKCINNEMIILLNDYNILGVITMVALIIDIIEFIKELENK